MSSKSKRAKAQKARDAKREAARGARPKKDFIPMPKAFNQSILQILQQVQMRVQDRVSAVMELNSDIPKDWRYNSQTGGFEPPPKPTPEPQPKPKKEETTGDAS